jgi:hypothetical protein
VCLDEVIGRLIPGARASTAYACLTPELQSGRLATHPPV